MRNECNEKYQQGEQGTRFESCVIQRVVYHFFSKHIIIISWLLSSLTLLCV